MPQPNSGIQPPAAEPEDRSVGRLLRDSTIDLVSASQILVQQAALVQAVMADDLPAAIPSLARWAATVGDVATLSARLAPLGLVWAAREWGARCQLAAHTSDHALTMAKLLFLSPGARTTRHAHDRRWEIHCPLADVGYLGPSQPQIQLGPLVGMFIRPGAEHRFFGTGPGVGVVLSLHVDAGSVERGRALTA